MAPSPDTPPRLLVFGAALTCGLLAALALHVALINAGWGLGTFMRDDTLVPPASTRGAVAWWLIAATAFIAGGVMTMLASGKVALRNLAIGATAATALLAFAGHAAQTPPGPSAGWSLALHLAAGGLAGLMAFAGAFVGLALRK